MAPARPGGGRRQVGAVVTAGILTMGGCTGAVDEREPEPRVTSSPAGRAPSASSTAPEREETAMNIRLTTGTGSYDATLNDSAAARDFADLLPLPLTLRDYVGTEKVSDLPEKLSTQGSPSGTAARAGDITFYAPWGNLAIFYKDFQHAEGLVKLGEITSGIEDFARPAGEVSVTIAAA
ncbi:cyclophilin-like fold protein [Streptomyces sp. NPDC101194]|uniref:cyclophilin-like fold protein n=1 Tax=Streptomyces sp. NPDC101194 TaxID=3366127 RepID=UPI0038259A4F